MILLQLLKILKFEEDLIDKEKYILSTRDSTITVIFDSVNIHNIHMVDVSFHNDIDKSASYIKIHQSSYMSYLNKAFAKEIRQYKIENILENTI